MWPTYRVDGVGGGDGVRKSASRYRRRPRRPTVCRPRGRNPTVCRPGSAPIGLRDVVPPT